MENKRVFKKGMTAIIIFLHIGAMAGGLRWWYSVDGFSMLSWVFFWALIFITDLGVNIGCHRYATHKSLEIKNLYVQRFLIACASIAGQQLGPWRINHHAHHWFTDTIHEPHSPYTPYNGGVRGFLWAHVGWLFYTYDPPERVLRFCERESGSEMKALVAWGGKWHLLFVLTGFLTPCLLAGMDGLLLAGFIRMVLALHATWCVNSVCHMWGGLVEGVKDHSRNNWLVALLAWGEGWHANHHSQQDAAFQGWYWWQVDFTKYIISFLELIGVATNVRRPRIEA